MPLIRITEGRVRAAFSTRKLALLSTILAVVFASFVAWSMPSPSTPNAMTRVGLTHAIVAHRSLYIDEIAPIEIDRAHLNGHYYCDKAPGVSLLCIVPVAVANLGMDLVGLDDSLLTTNMKRTPRFFGTALACLFGALIPLSTLGVLAFFNSLLKAGVEPSLARSGVLLFAFGTPFLYWSGSIFGHATTTALLTIGFAMYWSLGQSPPSDCRTLLVAGFVLAMAVTVEFLAAPASAAIGILIASRVDRSKGGWWSIGLALFTLGIGGLIPASLLLGYNYLAFGSPWHLGYGSVEGFEGMKTGFFGISAPRISVLWELTFGGYRGIIWISPVLLPAVYGCAKLAFKGPKREVGMLGLGVFAYYLCVNAGYFYWDGGWSTGPRHVTPSFGFLLFGLVLAFPGFSRPLRLITVLSAIYSVVTVMLITLVDSRARDIRQNVVFEHIIPDLMAGNSQMFLVHLGLPFVFAIGVPLIMFAVFLLWFRPGLGGSRTDPSFLG